MRNFAWILAMAVAVAGFTFAPAADAQANPGGFQRCGDKDLVLVFMNQDLNVQPDGFVHASGTFFIQFQARGPKAMAIDTLKFSFGVYKADVPPNCDTPEWITGVYIKNYRSDFDWKDGFFVPINTYNVGDGEYVAALSAYDKDGKELVRYFTKAKVNNGGRKHGQDPWPVKDFTQPWPMVLPGDGQRTDGKSGLYIEVAEPISDIKAYLNGRVLELTPTKAPQRDDDVVPDLCYAPCQRDPALSEGQVLKREWGPAFNWDGLIAEEDVISVKVTDKWGNVAEKVLHIGDPTIGGRVTGGNPDVEIAIESPSMTADENGTAVWNVTFRTKNDEGVHGDIKVSSAKGAPLPDGLTTQFSHHLMMGGKAESVRLITIVAGPSAERKTYDLEIALDYLGEGGTARVVKTAPIQFVVSDVAKEKPKEEFASKEGTNPKETISGSDEIVPANTQPQDKPTKKVPGIELPLLAVGLLGAALVSRRRRA